MKLVGTWEGNSNGESTALVIGREPVTVWLRVEDDPEGTSGSFGLSGGTPGDIRGAPRLPHFVVEPKRAGTKLTFTFTSSDDVICLKCGVRVIGYWALGVSAFCLLGAVLCAALAVWVLDRALLAVPDLGSAQPLVTAGVGAIVTVSGVQVARFWNVIWYWKRCAILLIVSVALQFVPRFWVCAVENRTDDELVLSRESEPVKLAPRSVAIVRKSLGRKSFLNGDWLKERFLCTSGEEGCEKEGIDAPPWMMLFPRRVELGCYVGSMASGYRAAWKKTGRCKPGPEFSAKIPIPERAEMVLQPFEDHDFSSKDLPREANLFLDEYRTLAAPPVAADDLSIEFDGNRRLKKTIVRLGQPAPDDPPKAKQKQAAIRLPAKVKDRSLLGTVRLGNETVGKLSCFLSPGGGAVALSLVSGTRYLRKLSVFAGEKGVKDGRLASSFEAERSDVGVETPLCWTDEISEVHFFLDDAWEPHPSWRLVLPRGPAIKTVLAFAQDHLWGKLECDCTTDQDCSVQALEIRGESVRGAEARRPKVKWTGSLASGEHLASWFLSCGPPPGEFRLTLENKGDKLFDSVHGTLGPLRPHPCAIDRNSGDEIQGRNPSTCTGPSAVDSLKDHPVAGCARTSASRLCDP